MRFGNVTTKPVARKQSPPDFDVAPPPRASRQVPLAGAARPATPAPLQPQQPQQPQQQTLPLQRSTRPHEQPQQQQQQQQQHHRDPYHHHQRAAHQQQQQQQQYVVEAESPTQQQQQQQLPMPSATGARLAELQTRVHEWRSDRDAAQVVFMQCNGAVERLQRSIEAATARLAKKRLLLAQHMPPPPPPQADHAGDAANASFTSTSTRHHGDAPLRREAAVQCDAGLCRAADLASRLDAAHRENLLALRGLRRPLIDAAVRRNLALAADVAGLVGRNRVMETELWLQVERFRAERMPPHQIEAAEQLVVSVLGAASGAGAGAGAGLDDTDEHCIDVSGVEPADRFDATELVYRTVEKARLALSRSLVPIRYNH